MYNLRSPSFTKNKFVAIDLFSGCGGSAWGFESAGFDIRAAIDINKTALDTFHNNLPKAEIINKSIEFVKGSDLRKKLNIKYGDNLLLLACPPCQGFSKARRSIQRLTDPRNNLIEEFVRLVEELEPVIFVLENVPGLATGTGRNLFKIIRNKLDLLGYDIVQEIVNTADYGIPQRRKRLIVLGTNNPNIRLSLPVKTNSNFAKPSDLAPWNTVRKAIGKLPHIKAGQKPKKDKMHISASLSEINLKRIKHTPRNGGSRLSWPEDLILKCHTKTNGYGDIYGRMKWDEPSPTITGGCVMISKGRYGHPEQDRAISLREAARLQTFPDSFRFEGNFGQIAEQIGNAVPPLLAKKTAEAIIKSIKQTI